jgi:hypothetical protein
MRYEAPSPLQIPKPRAYPLVALPYKEIAVAGIKER